MVVDIMKKSVVKKLPFNNRCDDLEVCWKEVDETETCESCFGNNAVLNF